MKRIGTALAMTISLLPLGLGCGVGQLCPDGVLQSGVQVLGGGIWVGADTVPPWLVDDDGGSIVRIGDVGSSPLEACLVLRGGITLGGSMSLVSSVTAQAEMPAFNGLEEIDGNITWVNFHPTDVVDAFNNLVTLGGGVSIQGNVGGMAGFNSLESMAFLDGTQHTTGYRSLQRVAGSVDVGNDISGLRALEFVGGDLIVWGSADTADLESLREVGGTVELDVRGNPIVDFPSLTEIGENLKITTSAISELQETSIRRIGGAVYIASNPALDSAHALEWVRSITQIDGEGELAEILGAPYIVCNNQGTAGNCEGEDNFDDSQ